MEITPKIPLPPTVLTLPKQSAKALSFLTPGKVFTATVQGSGNGNIEVKINDRLVKLNSDLSVVNGTTLKLKVEMADGQPVLRLISRQSTNQDIIQQALRQLLPKQQAIAQIFRQLAKLNMPLQQRLSPMYEGKALSTPLQSASHLAIKRDQAFSVSVQPRVLQFTEALLNQGIGKSTFPTIPANVEKALRNMFSELPTKEQISSGDGLQKAIANSGLFLENHLLSGVGKEGVNGDIKVLLLRLAQVIRQSLQIATKTKTPAAPQDRHTLSAQQQPTGRHGRGSQSVARQADTLALLQLIGRHSEAALSRIQVLQLNAHSHQSQHNEPAFTMELPLFSNGVAETLELKIFKDTRTNGKDDEECWSIQLTLDSDGFGAIRAIVSLVKNQVSTTFWCERDETREHFHNNLNTLQERLTEQGLQTGKTQAFTGIPPEQDNPVTSGTNGGFINEKA